MANRGTSTIYGTCAVDIGSDRFDVLEMASSVYVDRSHLVCYVTEKHSYAL